MTTTLYHRRASVAFIDDAARFCKVGHSFADADIEPREGGTADCSESYSSVN